MLFSSASTANSVHGPFQRDTRTSTVRAERFIKSKWEHPNAFPFTSTASESEVFNLVLFSRSSVLLVPLDLCNHNMAPAWLEKFITREDATPDPRLSSNQPTLEIHYSAIADHRRILGMKGDRVPHYEVKRQAVLGAWGNKCHVTSPANGDKEIAVIEFHALPRAFIEIQFPQRHHKIDISTSKQKFEASGGLGCLHWKGTGMEVCGQASWELRDETSLVMAVKIDQDQVNGLITFWRDSLDAETIEELVVAGIAKIEDYKRMIRTSKTSLVGAAANIGWLASS